MQKESVSSINAPKRIGIVETHGGGHRLVYVKLLAEYALGTGSEVTLITRQQVPDRPEFSVHIAPLVDSCSVAFVESIGDWEALHKIALAQDLQEIVVPDGDQWLRGAMHFQAKSVAYRVSLLVMRDPRLSDGASPSRVLRRVAKTVVLSALSRRGGAVRVLMLRDPVPGLWVRGRTVPDPVSPQPRMHIVEQLRSGLEDGVFWFGIVGAITERKSPLMIARAARQSGLRGCGLAIIGPQSFTDAYRTDLDATLQSLRKNGWRVHIEDRVLDDEEIAAAVVALDCVVVAYTNPNPPSTVSKATALGRLVIFAGPPGTIRSARRLGATGRSANLTADSIARALVDIRELEQPMPISLLGQGDFASALLDT